MSGNNVDVLLDAVARNAAVILSLPSAGMLRHHKSRFLSQSPEGLWIEGAPEDTVLIDELIASGTPAGVSFKTGTRMISFGSRVLKREDKFAINANVVVPAVLLSIPETIDSVQRRHSYRVRIPSDNDSIKTRIWRIPEHHFLADKPMASLEIPHQIYDASTGGLGVVLLPRHGEPVKGTRDERLRIELEYHGEHVILEGRLRLPNSAERNSKLRAGIAFKKMETNLDGRKALALLTKLVGDFQRDEIRRHRLGLREAG
jgi:c-di-GMP-binding flagellar brake protein YcgR